MPGVELDLVDLENEMMLPALHNGLMTRRPHLNSS